MTSASGHSPPEDGRPAPGREIQRRPSARWPISPTALIDEAITSLQREGVQIELEEARLLLDSNGVVRQKQGNRLHLRVASIRRVLRGLPSGFTLFDRDGRKSHAVVGGLARSQAPALHATITSAEAFVDHASGRTGPVPARERSTYEGPIVAREFDLLGAAPPLPDVPVVYGELHRLFTNMVASSRPQILRPKAADTLDGLRALLCVLRGTASEVEKKPYLILEAVAEGARGWGAQACRTIIDGARRGMPTALVAPAPGSQPWATWLGELTAELIAGIVIHHVSRQGAPLLWGVPLVYRDTLEPDAIEALDWALEAGRRLGLPTLATVVASEGAEASRSAGGSGRAPAGDASDWGHAAQRVAMWAARASVQGACIVAWGGLGDDPRRLDQEALRMHEQLVGDLLDFGREPRRRRWRAERARLEGDASTMPEGGARAAGSRERPLDAKRWEALAEVVRRESTRQSGTSAADESTEG